MDKEMIVTTTEQAIALQNTSFLDQFVKPQSPSQAAQNLGMAANLAHHHVKKLVALDLLEEVGRENGKVYYQLLAGVFKYDRRLVPISDDKNATVSTLKQFAERFLQAYERSDRIADRDDPDYSYVVFQSSESETDDRNSQRRTDNLEPRPAHMEIYTVSLSPERYRVLVKQISALLQEASEDVKDADEHTDKSSFAFLAFDDQTFKGSGVWSMLSSFIPNVR